MPGTTVLHRRTETPHRSVTLNGLLMTVTPRPDKMRPMISRTSLATTVLLAAAAVAAPHGRAMQADDTAAITATALDYIEGFYNGDAARMERALHPDLAKRIVRVNRATGKGTINHMGATELVGIARSREGKATPADKQQKDVTVLDVFGNAATVKVVANDWIDYLHVSKIDGRWVIVNVLWEMKPR